MKKHRQLHCSFCGKNETEVLKLVAGPHVYICDACVAIASRIMSDPHNDQPPGVPPSKWHRLLTRARRFIRGGAARRGAFGVSG